jgi:hypothetical protein
VPNVRVAAGVKTGEQRLAVIDAQEEATLRFREAVEACTV